MRILATGRILVTGLSTRAIAESAARGGHPVVTLDYFGDRDQQSLVENHSLLRDFGLPFSAGSLLQASRTLDSDCRLAAVVYISNLENHPGVVEELAQGRVLLGNAPDVLRQVRDWHTLRAFCHDAGVACPTTLLPGEESEADPTVRWLRKPVRSGGGHGVRRWAGEPLDENHVLQAYVEGRPASAAFVADGRRSVVIGLTEQLIGRGELGATRFAWCGNILPLPLQPADSVAVLEKVERMTAQLTRRFGLRGVNGVDLVVADGPDGRPHPFLVEVNPRYTGSMELVERAYGLNVFSLHLEAMAGRLPGFSLADHLHLQDRYLGKGIVYARRTVTLPETAGWTERDRRDVPFPGERIEAGHPVCTVLAEGEGREPCWNRLLASVEEVRREIGDR
ncbi:MAG TPA: ATP-grasp domain-containing protein [Anaerolineae bacterium]|nr:ATP-grasp domain-containing protein [Anaerolineae bacterium]